MSGVLRRWFGEGAIRVGRESGVNRDGRETGGNRDGMDRVSSDGEGVEETVFVGAC